MNQKKYQMAIDLYDHAVKIATQIKYRWIIPHALIEKAEGLYHLNKFDEALEVNSEGLELAKKVRSDYVLQSEILFAKIDFAIGKRIEAIQSLKGLLETRTEQEDVARILFQLFRIEVGKNKVMYCQKALKIYQQLYVKTPKYEYKECIEELRRS